MGLHFKQTPVTGFTNPAAAAETAVFVTPALPATGAANAPGSIPISISGTINLTPGTSATAATVRIRQGSGIGGTQISAAPVHTVAATSPQSISFGATDATGYLGAPGGQYTVTVQMTGGAATTTINMLDLEVLV